MYKGFMGTSGAPWMDHVLTDRIVIPPDLRHAHTEHVVYFPNTFFASDYPQAFPELLESPIPTAPTRAEAGLPEDAFVFANFNQLYKIDPATFAMWMRILQRVPGSVLWLLRTPPAAVENLQREAERLGMDPNRLVFTNIVPWNKHMATKSLAQLFIDTPNYNAHGSGTDVLWAGVPLLTLPGRKMSARVAASLVSALGVPELIARDAADYEEKAVYWATHPPALAALRARVERARTEGALFDTRRWARNFDRAASLLWDAHYSSGGARAHIVLRADSGTDKPAADAQLRDEL
jgi:protein O-GlcNAc transferase